MAGKRCRNIHFTARRRPRKATTARRGVRTRAPETAAPTPPVVTFTRDDLAAKLISLNVPSAREAQKSADRALTNVFAAIRHALAEADLTIPDFGTLRAARRETGREIRIRFHPDEKLKQAVEARLHAGP